MKNINKYTKKNTNQKYKYKSRTHKNVRPFRIEKRGGGGDDLEKDSIQKLGQDTKKN